MNSNTALIPVTEGTIQGRAQPLCDARDLYAFLEVRRDFTSWMKQRIARYGFVEGEDYEVFHKFVENPQGDRRGRPTDEYHLTIDMAKELAMVENNERGRQARRYFIECERIAIDKREGKAELLEPFADDLSTGKDRALFSRVRRLIIDRAARAHCVMADNRVRSFGWWDYSDSHCIIIGELDALYEIREGHVPPPWEYDDLGRSFRIRPPAGCGVLFAANQTGEPMRQDLFLLPPAKIVIVGTPDETEEMLETDGLQFSRIITKKQPRFGLSEDRQ